MIDANASNTQLLVLVELLIATLSFMVLSNNNIEQERDAIVLHKHILCIPNIIFFHVRYYDYYNYDYYYDYQ